MSAEYNSGADYSETPAERKRRRFFRRWKRRALALSPLLGVALVFCALALSMDIVRYLPVAQAAKSRGSSIEPRPLARLENPAPPIELVRPDAVISPSSATITGLDPKSFSLDITSSGNSAAHVNLNSNHSRSRR